MFSSSRRQHSQQRCAAATTHIYAIGQRASSKDTHIFGARRRRHFTQSRCAKVVAPLIYAEKRSMPPPSRLDILHHAQYHIIRAEATYNILSHAAMNMRATPPSPEEPAQHMGTLARSLPNIDSRMMSLQVPSGQQQAKIDGPRPASSTLR